MLNIKFAIFAAGLVASLPVLAQTAGNTPNRGPEGTGNFVSGKEGKAQEKDANYTKPEGEGTSYVGGRPADKAK